MAAPTTRTDTAATTTTVSASPAVPWATHLLTALLGAWIMVGLLLDAWAHNNQPRLESFFTPWHAVFYSGFVATAGWVLWTVRAGLLGRPRLRDLPPGYAPTVVALAGFAVAGLGDGLWHGAFGVERSIAILFSPTHLGLAVALAIIVSTPVRAAWADPGLPEVPGLRRLLPALLSSALTTALVLLFVQYGNALTYPAERYVSALGGGDVALTARLATAMALTTLVLVTPLVMLARRWVVPFGTATLLYVAAGALAAAVTGLATLDIVGGLLVAGPVVDGLGLLLRPIGSRTARVRAYAALAPLFTWAIVIVTAYLSAGSPAEAAPAAHPEAALELYLGVPVAQALLGLLVGTLATVGAPTSSAADAWSGEAAAPRSAPTPRRPVEDVLDLA